MAERPGIPNLLERIRNRRLSPEVHDRVSQVERPNLPPPDYEPPQGSMPTEQVELPFQPRRIGAEAGGQAVDGDRPSTLAQRLFAWSGRGAEADPATAHAPVARRERGSWQDQWGFGLAGLMLVLIAGAGAIFHWSGSSASADAEANRAEAPRVPGAPVSTGRSENPDRADKAETKEKFGRPDRAAPPSALPEPKRAPEPKHAEREAPSSAPPAETESDRTAPPSGAPPAATPPKREPGTAPRLATGAADFVRHLIREKRISAACVRESGGAQKAISVRPIALGDSGNGEFAVRRQGACCKEGKRCGVAIYARSETGFRTLLLARPADQIRPGASVHHGYRDVRHQDRQRTAGPFETVFRFDGQHYRKIACFEAPWAGPKPQRGARPIGKWQRISCDIAVAGKTRPKKARETADIEAPPTE